MSYLSPPLQVYLEMVDQEALGEEVLAFQHFESHLVDVLEQVRSDYPLVLGVVNQIS